MPFFIVFGSTKRPHGFMGDTYLDWGNPPIGVYLAADAEEAFRAAAKDSDHFGTFFAVEGTPHGAEMLETSAKQLGKRESAADRMDRLANLLEQRVNQALPPGNDSGEAA